MVNNFDILLIVCGLLVNVVLKIFCKLLVGLVEMSIIWLLVLVKLMVVVLVVVVLLMLFLLVKNK